MTQQTKLYTPKKFTTRTYNLWISQFIDRFNYGLLINNNVKKYKYTSQFINQCFKSKNPRLISSLKLSEKEMKDHLNNTATYFYTTKRDSLVVLYKIDLDPTDSSEYRDLLEATLYIIKYFHPNAYYEISTTGRGIHIYFLLDISGYTYLHSHSPIKRRDINHLITHSFYSNSYFSLLSRLINFNFDCKCCGIYGGYTGKGEDRRGDLAKLPRPQSEDDFFRLVNTPMQTLCDIRENMEVIKDWLEELKEGKADSFSSHSSSPHSKKDESLEISPGDPGSSNSSPGISLVSIIPSNILSTHSDVETTQNSDQSDDKYLNTKELMYSDNPFNRVLYSCLYMSHGLLKRIPEFDEWHSFYINNNLHTGGITKEEIKKRETRYNCAVKVISRDFDPDKCKADYLVGDYVDDIKKRISLCRIKELSQAAGYPRTITYEDVDVGMGYHWTSVIHNQRPGKELTVPVDGMIEWFKGLKEKQLIKRSCNYSKIRAIRSILIEIGYITLLNENYEWDRTGRKKGKAMQWGIGENFPRYSDYKLLVKQEVVDKVIREAGGNSVVEEKVA